MVDFVTSKFEFLVVPRKKILLLFVELTTLRRLDKKLCSSNRIANKYVMVTRVYPSHIGFKGIVDNRRGEVVT